MHSVNIVIGAALDMPFYSCYNYNEISFPIHYFDFTTVGKAELIYCKAKIMLTFPVICFSF